MLKNYLKIALRNLRRQKVYSFINISGLAVGMACVLLIGLYIQDELSYDRYHEKADRIFRVTKSPSGAPIPTFIGTQAPLGPALKNQYPEIENFVRFDPFFFKPKVLMTYEDRSFYEDRFFLADPAIFDVFDFKLLQGTPKTALAAPNSLVLTKSMADKYFGIEDPMGKILRYDNDKTFIVSGVLEDVPHNSHFTFDFIGSFEHINDMYGGWDIANSWRHSNFYTYILLKENVQQKAFEEKSTVFLREITNNPDNLLYLQPITDIYLHSKIAGDPNPRGNVKNIALFSSIATLMLLIACINFMNLYSANSEVRAKEVGLRKVLGAQKKQLVSQILGESFFLSIIALPIAVLLVELIIPRFNLIMGKSLDIEYAQNTILLSGLLFMTLFVGLVSGFYPALVISSFRPILILHRRKLNAGKKGFTFRNILVIFQFTVSIALIAGSLIINNQMAYIGNRNLGYDRENIINIPMNSPETKTNYETYRGEIVQHANIIDATATSFTPSVTRWREGMYFEGRTSQDNQSFFRMSGDFNLIDLFGMEIIEGRTFDRNIPTDLNNTYILNESAINEIGWGREEAIGKAFGNKEGKVIGVVKDFHFMSLRFDMRPMVINVLPRMFDYISIKLNPVDLPNTLQFLESKWNEMNPSFPFEYYFYDDEFDKLYKGETKLATIIGVFTFLTVFIACLGLFGLSLFTVQQRIKEIGIRKVLGASVANIVLMLSKDFIKLVLLAILMASPIAYFAMNSWLQNFAYHTKIGLGTIVLSGCSTLVIAFLTVFYQVVRSAAANPAETLKYE